jgi:hypothetical protein
VASATRRAARRSVAAGAAGDGRYYFRSPTVYSDTPPCGYRLTDAQYRPLQRTLALLGVAARRDGGSWVIPNAQATRPTIGLLLDGRAAREITSAQDVPC